MKRLWPILLLAGCGSPQPEPPAAPPKPTPRHSMAVMAHRGNGNGYPENSLAAFGALIGSRVSMAECDLRVNRANQIVVSHDAKGADTAPLFTDLLATVNGRISLILHLKEPMIDHLVNVIRQSQTDPHTLYPMPPTATEIDLMHASLPEAHYVLVSNGVPDFATPVNAEAVALNWDAIDRDTVKRAHHNHLKIFAWTVNTEKEADRAETDGVDAIITDRPFDLLSRPVQNTVSAQE